MRSLRMRVCAAVALGLLTQLARPAEAHHKASGDSSAYAIAIPGLTHGQMQVIADNRAAVLALADRQIFTDPTFRRLRNFINIQYTICLWGMVPGSVRDEASPFNECSHAYLAAVSALLAYMRAMPAAADNASLISDDIGRQMLLNGTASVLCRYSGEPFNTGEIIMPCWGCVPTHAPSLLFFASVASLLLAAAGAFHDLTRARRDERVASTAAPS